ncbi:TetR/AcrR family transcriptional regulator [Undibacterium jejuense]|uniref:TetR/AcrR family transcriptional regulator n=1 Tax=Undibacterium jejuense TaxID=1344949 RepID=A0A923KQB4_9BURK|nr:TetR/AcrR family transcriptional regulator [Undibacterium jejuense]MBC3862676.1 TetR/AcrR family transcriptional regulator [Undibacterium jejuense]
MNLVSQRPTHQDTRERILATGEELISGRGFTALGLSEILSAAAVPKGSFYHYFQSKEGFGVAMLERYFSDYQQRLTLLFNDESMNALQRIMTYFNNWQAMAETSECHKLCLAVKLAAEVADLSEPMRAALSVGMSGITEQIAQAIRNAQIEGSISNKLNALEIAESLYGMWVGASLITKVNRQLRPLQLAFKQTELLLHPSH